MVMTIIVPRLDKIGIFNSRCRTRLEVVTQKKGCLIQTTRIQNKAYGIYLIADKQACQI